MLTDVFLSPCADLEACNRNQAEWDLVRSSPQDHSTDSNQDVKRQTPDCATQQRVCRGSEGAAWQRAVG